MRVLQVNIVANSGSTGKITTDLHKSLLAEGHESVVCYGAGETIADPLYYRLCSEFERHVYCIIQQIIGISYGKNEYFSTNRLIKKIKNYKPDIVHLQCINGNFIDIYKILAFLSSERIKTVVTLHAEFMHTGTCGYAYDCTKFMDNRGCIKCSRHTELLAPFENVHRSWVLMYKAFSNFDVKNIKIISVSPWLCKRASESTILRKFSHDAVYNGIDITVFNFHKINNKGIKDRFDNAKPLVLWVSARFSMDPSHVKGGCHIVELAKMNPDMLFCMVTLDTFEIGDLPSNIIYWGRTNNQQELSDLYCRANITVLTSRKETFSMIVAESLCCGTPIVGFKAGGPESICITEFCNFVEQGDIKALNNALHEKLSEKIDKAFIADNAQNIYSKEEMTRQYLNIYTSLLNDEKN